MVTVSLFPHQHGLQTMLPKDVEGIIAPYVGEQLRKNEKILFVMRTSEIPLLVTSERVFEVEDGINVATRQVWMETKFATFCVMGVLPLLLMLSQSFRRFL